MSKKNLIIIISSVAAGLILLGALGIWLVNIFKSGNKQSAGSGGNAVISVGCFCRNGKEHKGSGKLYGQPGRHGLFYRV